MDAPEHIAKVKEDGDRLATLLRGAASEYLLPIIGDAVRSGVTPRAVMLAVSYLSADLIGSMAASYSSSSEHAGEAATTCCDLVNKVLHGTDWAAVRETLDRYRIGAALASRAGAGVQ